MISYRLIYVEFNTSEDQSLLKRFSGKSLLRIAALSTPEQREAHIERIRAKEDLAL